MTLISNHWRVAGQYVDNIVCDIKFTNLYLCARLQLFSNILFTYGQTVINDHTGLKYEIKSQILVKHFYQL